MHQFTPSITSHITSHYIQTLSIMKKHTALRDALCVLYSTDVGKKAKLFLCFINYHAMKTDPCA